MREVGDQLAKSYRVGSIGKTAALGHVKRLVRSAEGAWALGRRNDVTKCKSDISSLTTMFACLTYDTASGNPMV